MLRVGGGLDSNAVRYLRLLNDPCNGELTYSVAPGGTGGYIIRLVTQLTLGASGPSAVCTIFPGRNTYTNNGSAGSGTGFTPSLNVLYTWSGLNGAANAAERDVFRTVAACVDVIANASELNRAGILYLGHIQEGQITNNQSITPSNVFSMANHVVRVPGRKITLKWLPMSVRDADFNQSPGGSFATLSDSTTGLLLGLDGDASGAGCTLRVTTVYEIRPGFAAGVAQAAAAPTSRNSLNDVLRAFFNGAGRVLEGIVASETVKYVAEAGGAAAARFGAQYAAGLLEGGATPLLLGM